MIEFPDRSAYIRTRFPVTQVHNEAVDDQAQKVQDREHSQPWPPIRRRAVLDIELASETHEQQRRQEKKVNTQQADQPDWVEEVDPGSHPISGVRGCEYTTQGDRDHEPMKEFW